MLNLGRDYIDSNQYFFYYGIDRDGNLGNLDVSKLENGVYCTFVDFRDATGILEEEIDRARMSRGLLPFFERNANTDVDEDGYYEFSLCFSRDECISLLVKVCNTSSWDNNFWCEISLNEEDKKIFYERIVSIIGKNKWNESFDRKEN